jgi:hypothetical protein
VVPKCKESPTLERVAIRRSVIQTKNTSKCDQINKVEVGGDMEGLLLVQSLDFYGLLFQDCTVLPLHL